MKRLKLFRSLALLALTIALPRAALSQDTLSISGTFRPAEISGVIGADLAHVLANGHDHGWKLTLYGVTVSHDYSSYQWMTDWGMGYRETYLTRVSATSLDLEFVGPDADVLNEVVGPASGAVLELFNAYQFDPVDEMNSGSHTGWAAGVVGSLGFSFAAGGSWSSPPFDSDESGFPGVYPQRVISDWARIQDSRPGNGGWLWSYGGLVDIGSPVPPVLPPTLSIADGFVREGNKGTTRLKLEVTLSRSITDVVTVRYATASGTAVATSDYTSASGTLTFQPGQTSGTVSIAIKGDRKREKDESFEVRLSNAAGATIADGIGVVTILNDD